jgi:hypothetical protein
MDEKFNLNSIEFFTVLPKLELCKKVRGKTVPMLI